MWVVRNDYLPLCYKINNMNNNKLKLMAWVSMITFIIIILVACGLNGPLEPGILSNMLVVMLIISMLGVVIPLIISKDE
jgi:hypothetical protein